jgi:hypothetical protein
MAITLYVGGKSVYSKKAKPVDEYVLDPVFEAAAIESEYHQSHLREFLNDREHERTEKKNKLAKQARERSSCGA